MSHAWRETGEFPYSKDSSGNENRQRVICDNCGFETHRHQVPKDDEKVPYYPSHESNAIWYVFCEEMVLLKVMDS